MPSVTARSLGVIMWCLPLVLQPSTTLASEQQAKASSEQQTKNPNAPPAFNESAQPPGAQARDGSPGKKPLASPSVAVSRKEEAWHTLETACTGDKATDRANATRVLGLIRNDVKATKLAEKALSDPKPEVRAAAAAALGDMDYWTSGSWTKKIQIVDLDLPATLKLNHERGVKFALPVAPYEVVMR